MIRSKIQEAIEFSRRAHAGQFRKGTQISYVTHPIQVSQILLNHGCPESWAIAGLLHDVLEDTKTPLKEIQTLFGDQIATWVTHLSEPDKSDTWENRKKHTLEYLKIAPLEIVTISCADKLDNIQSMRHDLEHLGEALWKRFNRPQEKQRWYYQSLAHIFSERLTKEPGLSISQLFQEEVKKVFGCSFCKNGNYKDSSEINREALEMLVQIGTIGGVGNTETHTICRCKHCNHYFLFHDDEAGDMSDRYHFGIYLLDEKKAQTAIEKFKKCPNQGHRSCTCKLHDESRYLVRDLQGKLTFSKSG